jgi:predicted transcriptional regulator
MTETTTTNPDPPQDIELTAEIVTAYVSNNPVPPSELSSLIASVHSALKSLSTAKVEAQPEPQQPAVNPKRSVFPDYIICLEDGKKFKSLKRHLAAHHGMTPEEYRTKWNLPGDYPMVAPAYSEARSAMAKKMGLGKKVAPEPQPTKNGRRKAA